MHRATRIKITELNPHLVCALCGGYYIDAATIIECLHSFCRTCIVNYLQSNKYCPICDVMVHKTKPLEHVKSDKTLQDLVYKLVPGLYKNEMKKRRDFYAEHPDEGKATVGHTEERGDEDHDRLIYASDEKISLCLELYSESQEDKIKPDTGQKGLKKRDTRYLLCPAAFTVAHIKKFIRLKFDLPHKYKIDVFHSEEPLDDFFSLMDIAYIYTWRRKSPLRLVYTIYEVPQCKVSQSIKELCKEDTETRLNVDENEKVQQPREENGNADVKNEEPHGNDDAKIKDLDEEEMPEVVLKTVVYSDPENNENCTELFDQSTDNEVEDSLQTTSCENEEKLRTKDHPKDSSMEGVLVESVPDQNQEQTVPYCDDMMFTSGETKIDLKAPSAADDTSSKTESRDKAKEEKTKMEVCDSVYDFKDRDSPVHFPVNGFRTYAAKQKTVLNVPHSRFGAGEMIPNGHAPPRDKVTNGHQAPPRLSNGHIPTKPKPSSKPPKTKGTKNNSAKSPKDSPRGTKRPYNSSKLKDKAEPSPPKRIGLLTGKAIVGSPSDTLKKLKKKDTSIKAVLESLAKAKFNDTGKDVFDSPGMMKSSDFTGLYSHNIFNSFNS